MNFSRYSQYGKLSMHATYNNNTNNSDFIISDLVAYFLLKKCVDWL